MKLKSLLVFIIGVLSSICTQGQASTSGNFGFFIGLPTLSTHNTYRLFFLPRNGHNIDRITVQHGVVDHTLVMRGHSSYIVGVPFPLFLLEENVFNNGIITGKNYYQIQYSSQGTDGNMFPWIQLAPTYRSLLVEPLNMYHGEVTVKVSHCNHPECIDHFNALAGTDQLWRPLPIEAFNNRIRTEWIGPERANVYLIILDTQETFTDHMNIFSKKYQVSFEYKDCSIMPGCIESVRIHNQKVISQLNRRYGMQWTKELPVSIEGW